MIEEKDIIIFYKTHTGKDTCKKFNITKNTLDKILIENNVTKHTLKEARQINLIDGTFKLPPSTEGKHHYNDGVKNYFITDEEASKLNLKSGFIKMSDEKKKEKQLKFETTNELLYGNKHYNNREKSKETTFKHYGVYNIAQSKEYHKKACKKYLYKGISFDSSWELALYIYAKDHDEYIERAPCELSYHAENKDRKYIPDFNYKGQLIEVKGDHLIKNGELRGVYDKGENKSIYRAKQECIKNNNVQIWVRKDIQFALDYIESVYGKDYLKSFKNK